MVFLAGLVSCHPEIKRYKSMVDRCDQFTIYYRDSNKTIPVPLAYTPDFKEALKRGIQVRSPHKLYADTRIDMFEGTKKIGALMISGTRINFKSDSLNFSFRLTYGLGMRVDGARRHAGPAKDK